ncbi:MAG: tetratricopeptide repeat protein [Planctomycetota bacterium]|jgi:MoaA/NifB/PqqE/SkfB family radical SAM enzyme/Flp pilus assembly protein TadD
MYLTKTEYTRELAAVDELIKEGRTQEAIERLSGILDQDPENGEICTKLCRLYLNQGSAILPQAWLTKAIRYDPALAEEVIDLSTTLFGEKRYYECEQLLVNLLEGDRDNHEAWNDLGTVRFSQDNLFGAEEAFLRSLELKPGYGLAVINLCSLYCLLNQQKGAVQLAAGALDESSDLTSKGLRDLAALIEASDPDVAGKLRFKAGSEPSIESVEDAAGSPSEEEEDRVFDPDLNKKAVVWYATMKCNNRCPYCLAFQQQDPMIQVPFRDYKDWVNAWNRFEGELMLDITGGEPFLIPNIVDLIKELNENITVGITTNTRRDLTEFVQAISPEKCTSVTCSLHPSSPQNFEDFLGKIMLLKGRGFHVVVNFVAYPEQLWMIPYYKRLVEDAGVVFHVDPYGPGPKRPYELAEREKEFLKNYVGMDRGDFFNTKPVLYQCSGGMNFFSTLPNGDTYTCVTKRYVPENFVGNLFDEDFKPFSEPIQCTAVSCAGCDLDKVTRIAADQVINP